MTRTFLVVDDEPDLRELMKLSLELMGGYNVAVATSGKEAVEMVAKDRPDAVVMDVQMPGMDGPSTVRAIHNAEPDAPPIIFITASVLESDLVSLRAMPVSGVLAKPFDPTTLAGELEQLLGWSP